jgi:hypothetical protein
MVFDYLLNEQMVKEILAFAFLLCIALGIYEFSSKVEEMGDDTE